MLEALQQTIDLLKDTQLSESDLSPSASVEATPPPHGPWEANRDLATEVLQVIIYYTGDCNMYNVYTIHTYIKLFHACLLPRVSPRFDMLIEFGMHWILCISGG